MKIKKKRTSRERERECQRRSHDPPWPTAKNAGRVEPEEVVEAVVEVLAEVVEVVEVAERGFQTGGGGGV
jgi:hypothetical protein